MPVKDKNGEFVYSGTELKKFGMNADDSATMRVSDLIHDNATTASIQFISPDMLGDKEMQTQIAKAKAILKAAIPSAPFKTILQVENRLDSEHAPVAAAIVRYLEAPHVGEVKMSGIPMGNKPSRTIG